jgi:hypothetical protein
MDVLPSTTTDNVVSTTAETAATTGLSATYDLDGNGIFSPEGMPITVNTADLDAQSISIGPESLRNEILKVSNNYLNNRKPIPSATTGASTTTPPTQWVPVLTYCDAKATYSAGTITLYGYLVRQTSAGISAGSEEIPLFAVAGAATTVLLQPSQLDFRDSTWPLNGGRGNRIVIIYKDESTPTMTVGTLNVQGFVFPN